MIYPIAFRQLLQILPFGWSVRVLAFIILATGTLSLITIRPRCSQQTKRKLSFDYEAFLENPPYAVYTLASIFTISAQYTPAFFIQDYALGKGIMDENLASYLLPMLNACSVLGRIAPNLIADRIGGLNVMIPAVFIATLLSFVWIAISTTAGCIVFSCLYGFSIGSILSLPPFVIASLCSDKRVIGTRLGNSFAVASFGLLFGPPVAAAILQSGSWIGTQLFAACMLTVALSALLIARFFIIGPHLLRKV